MKPRDAAGLMFVGLGILSLVYAIAKIQGAFLTYGSGNSLFSRIAYLMTGLLPMACYFWLAIHLIRNRDRYSRQMFPDSAISTEGPSINDPYLIGLSLIGVYLIVTAIPMILHYCVRAIVYVIQVIFNSHVSDRSGGPTVYIGVFVGGFMAPIGKLVIGILLISKRFKIADLLSSQKEEIKTPEPVILACPSCNHPYQYSDYREDAKEIFCSKCKTQLDMVQDKDK